MIIQHESEQVINQVIDQRYTVVQSLQRTNYTQQPFIDLKLRNGGQILPAYIWPDKGDCSVSVPEGVDVLVSGVKRDLSGEMVLDILDICIVPPEWIKASNMDLVEHLWQKADKGILTKSLRTCIFNVLSDKDIIQPFVVASASKDHHHYHEGGLLEHSLEVAVSLENNSILVNNYTKPELEVAWIAGLLHDVGKIRQRVRGMFNPAAFLVKHDDLILEILSQHLKQLDAEDQDLGAMLRYLLVWNDSVYGKRPLLPLALAVKSADRMSAATAVYRMACHQDTRKLQYVTYNTKGKADRFWRLGVD
jgi:hypothetical protein